MIQPKKRGVPLYRQNYANISRERAALKQSIKAQQRYITTLQKRLKKATHLKLKKNLELQKRRVTVLQQHVSNLELSLQKSQLACLALIHAAPKLKTIRKEIYKQVINQ